MQDAQKQELPGTPTATLVRKYDANTALYECSPPMLFLTRKLTPSNHEMEEHSKVVICSGSGSAGRGYWSTVIHSATELQGGEGAAYGAGASRVLDGVSQHHEALAISGYQVAT